MKDPSVYIKPPADFTMSQKAEFVALVSEGGEVANGLDKRIERAAALVMIARGDATLGVAALKRPKPSYRDRVFNKAGVADHADNYDFEIGWIFVRQAYRGQGLSKQLVRAARDAAHGSRVFATTRSDNLPMQHVLIQNGFKPCGNAYASVQNPGSTLQLFVTNAPSGDKARPAPGDTP